MTPEAVAIRRKLTYRESLVVRALIDGKNKGDALRAAGFPESVATNPFRVITPELEAEIERVTDTLVAYQIERGLVDAAELHEQLSELVRGDIADLYDNTGELLPVKQWPMWARQGGVEILDAPNMVPSADGEGKSWDQVGRKITVRATSRAKDRESLMKHKGVNAMVEAKQGDVHLHLHAEVTAKLQGALKRKELADARNVTPKGE